MIGKSGSKCYPGVGLRRTNDPMRVFRVEARDDRVECGCVSIREDPRSFDFRPVVTIDQVRCYPVEYNAGERNPEQRVCDLSCGPVVGERANFSQRCRECRGSIRRWRWQPQLTAGSKKERTCA